MFYRAIVFCDPDSLLKVDFNGEFPFARAKALLPNDVAAELLRNGEPKFSFQEFEYLLDNYCVCLLEPIDNGSNFDYALRQHGLVVDDSFYDKEVAIKYAMSKTGCSRKEVLLIHKEDEQDLAQLRRTYRL